MLTRLECALRARKGRRVLTIEAARPLRAKRPPLTPPRAKRRDLKPPKPQRRRRIAKRNDAMQFQLSNLRAAVNAAAERNAALIFDGDRVALLPRDRINWPTIESLPLDSALEAGGDALVSFAKFGAPRG